METRVNAGFAAPCLPKVLTSIFHDQHRERESHIQKYHTKKGDIDAKKDQVLTHKRNFNHWSA